MKNDLYIVNKEHPDFVRLYWSTDKEKIKHILSRVNVKYLRGLIRQFFVEDSEWFEYEYDVNNIVVFLRYDGYQFLVSEKTVIKELYRRGSNMEHECVIGIWNDYDNSPLVTMSELVKLQPKSVYTMKQYCDWRYSTNLTRFVHCPYCGKKINWKL